MNYNSLKSKCLMAFGVIITGTFFSCNNIPEAIMMANTERVDTLDFYDYKYVVDKKDRRGYVTEDNEVMEGQYVIKRNGVMTEEFTIKGGFLNGQRILYYENGMPESIETYKTSVQDGPVTFFYRNGAIKSETSYTNGQADVEEVNYNENGEVTLRRTLEDGIVYEHNYKGGNRMVSTFTKPIAGKEYELILKYDDFGQIQLIMGKLTSDTAPVFYIFDTEYTVIDSFNGEEAPLKAQQYFSILQEW